MMCNDIKSKIFRRKYKIVLFFRNMYILMLFKYKFKNKVLNIFVIILFLIEKIKIYVNFVFRFEILLK